MLPGNIDRFAFPEHRLDQPDMQIGQPGQQLSGYATIAKGNFQTGNFWINYRGGIGTADAAPPARGWRAKPALDLFNGHLITD